MTIARIAIVSCVVSLAMGAPARAWVQSAVDRADFDAASGRSLRHFPPDRVVDFEHMKLELRIDDMNVPRMECRQTLSFEVIAGPLETLSLDARLMDITSVAWSHGALEYTADGRTLEVVFDPPLARGERVEIVTDYTVTRPPEGLYWTPESDAWPGRAAQIHSQGEAETNSYWFPCHDFPNDRLTTEIVATVPAEYIVSSNGRLVSHETVEDGAYETYHWLQSKPHVNYLVTLVVGKFDIVDVGTDALPLPVYVPVGRGSDVLGTYGRTQDMIDFFQDLLDEPYPWDRYAQLVVWNFNFGGMENTSATTMHDTAILSHDALTDYDMEGLIAHELAHQWFGDFITCKSWEHIWLNEGFATYLTALWFEHRDGSAGYQAAIRGNFDAVIGRDRGAAPFQPGMVSNVYDAPLDAFFKAANPYSKGAAILHMLRRRLGDEVFFACLAAYLGQYQLQTVETSDFRKVVEEVSGESLERFFTQWCSRPGLPRVEVDLEWDESARELVVTLEQTQQIDGYNPAYAFTVPLRIEQSDGRAGLVEVSMDARHASMRIPLDTEPDLVAVDPEMNVLAEWTVNQPADRWIAQLDRGPTLAARIQAARALATDHSYAATAMLVRTAENRSLHESVRSAALFSLAARGEEGRLMALGGVAFESPDVRASLIDSFVSVADPSRSFRDFMSSVLDDSARRDPAQSVRAAAVRAIGRAGLEQRLGVVAVSLKIESQHDAIRRAAINSVADLGAGVDLVLPFVEPGFLARTRAAAISAAVDLAEQDPDAVFEAISPLLHDPVRRVHRAAGAALVDLGDPRGIEALRTFIESRRDPIERSTASAWLEALEAVIESGS